MLTKIVTLLICLCAFSFELSASTDGFSDRAMLQARDALLAGDSQQALHELGPYIEDKSIFDAPKMRLLAARAHLEMNVFKQALTYLEGLEESLAEIAPTVWGLRARAYRGLQAWAAIEELWLHVLQSLVHICLTLHLAQAKPNCIALFFSLEECILQ